MKKTLSILLLIFSYLLAQSQNYEKIKNRIAINQLPEAKEEFEKAVLKEKFSAKAEAFILKSTLYASIAVEANMIGKQESLPILSTADEAYTKYLSMDPNTELAYKDPIYQRAAVNLYQGYFKWGYAKYEEKKWEEAYDAFKSVTKYSDELYKAKLLQSPLDTNVVLLSGMVAENSGKKAEAFKHYQKIADAKLLGEAGGYESIYRFLVLNSFENNKMAEFAKYKALGAEIFPASEYFKYDETDFTLGLFSDFDKRVEFLKKVLSSKPNDEKANFTLAQLIFDTIYPKKDDVLRHANAAALEIEFEAALTKATLASPNNELAWVLHGNHYINKSIPVGDTLQNFKVALVKKYKVLDKIVGADKEKKETMEKEYNTVLNQAKGYYEKAAELFAAKPKLTNHDKKHYKSVAGFLSEIAASNKSINKADKTLVAKYEAEVEKWDKVNEGIKY